MDLNNTALAAENWARYQYGLQRGHNDFCITAQRCEQMYLGGGEQWTVEDRAYLKEQRRPAYEFNEIMPRINSALGYQIHNRMDISFKPRGGLADQDKADIRSKVTMQIADQCRLHWKESQVFADGLIQQRGYFDLRMSFDKVVTGEADICVPDPFDVIPDPDAKSYDSEEWSDVLITRWMTYDEIEQMYGKKARTQVENMGVSDEDFGQDLNEVDRNKFGSDVMGARFDAHMGGSSTPRVRVIDRQKWVYTMGKVLIDQSTGDVTPIEGASPDQVAKWTSQGKFEAKRMHKRVRWVVSAADQVLLHDDWSPYPWLTIVPYFAYFRRGKTRGLVDNAIGPQEAYNKAMSQFVHIINTAANSGWQMEENQLTNMTESELEEKGATTGLVLVRKAGTPELKKIQPNAIPTGVDRLIDHATRALKEVTVPDAMTGDSGPEVSGVAIQSKQFASQQQLAVPLDNLARTRNILARRLSDLITLFYTDERVFRITETDPMTGKKFDAPVQINQFDPQTGEYMNDVTVGTYDVVISEVPMQITFENSQFQQALEMRKVGIQVPDHIVIRHSNLADKGEILESMENAPTADPEAEAKAALVVAQTKKAEMETVAKSVEAQYSAIQTAQVIAATPQTSGLADSLLKSAGYEDKDAAPIVPTLDAPIPGIAPAQNTNPLTPANPAVGMMAGIETPEGPDQKPLETA